MVRLQTTGFELGSNAEFQSVTGSPSYDTTTVRSGVYSLRANPTASQAYVSLRYEETGGGDIYFYRFYLYISSAPSGNIDIARVFDGDLNNGCAIRLTTSRTLLLWGYFVGAQVGSASSALSLDTWYRIEFQGDWDTNAVSARVDGTQFASGFNAFGAWALRLGAGVSGESATCDLYFDDVAVNDDSGTVQNTWPGAGNVVHLRPNAAGDVNPTTGTWDSINEVPPDNADFVSQQSVATAWFGLEAAADRNIQTGESITLVQPGQIVSTSTTTSRAYTSSIQSQASGTKVNGATHDIASTSWVIYDDDDVWKHPSLVQYVDPQGGGAWTPALLDSTQIGLRATNGDTTHYIRASSMWLLVEYVESIPSGPPSFRTGSAVGGGDTSGTSVGTLTLDADVLVDDVVVFVLYKENTAAVTPGGTAVTTWYTTQQNGDGAPDIAGHLCVGRVTTAGGTITCSWTGSAYYQWAYVAYDDCIDTGDPRDVTPTGVADSTANTTCDTPAITTVTDNCMIVRAAVTFGNQPWTPPTDFIERWDNATIGEVSIADKVLALAGTDAATTFTQTSTGESVGLTVALKPLPVTLPQTAAPASDISVGTWTTDSGGTSNLYQQIDEAAASISDADYVRSVQWPQNEMLEVSLTSLVDPLSSSGHVVSVRALVDASGPEASLYTDLMQGTSPLVEWLDTPLTTTAQTFTHTLSGAQADSITDYSDLRLRFYANQVSAPTPTYVAASALAVTATNGASFTPAIPTGTQGQDILLLVIWRNDNSSPTDPANGWTQIDAALDGVNASTSTQSTRWYWKVAAGTAGSGTSTTATAITYGTSTVVRGGRMFAIRAADTTTPFATVSGGGGAYTRLNNAHQASGSGSATDTTDLTPEQTNVLGLVVAVSYGQRTTATITGASGWATPSLLSSTTGTDSTVTVSNKPFTTPEALDAPTISTSTTTTAGVSAGFLFALRPAATTSRVRVTWAQLEVPEAAGTLLTFSGGGTLTSAGALRQDVSRTLTGTFATAGAISRNLSRALSGTLSSAGTLIKATSTPLTGTLASAGSLALVKVKLLDLSGTLVPAGAVLKQVGRALAGALTPTSPLFRLASTRSLGGILSPSGGISVPPYRDAVLADSPIGYWRLGETGGTQAADISGNARHGTYTGGYTLNQTGALTGDANPAVLFNGTSGYVVVPATGLGLDTGPGSMECWARLDADSIDNPRVLAFGGNQAWSVFADGGSHNLSIFNFNGGVRNTGYLLTEGTTYHIVLTVSATNVIVYVNGASVFDEAFSEAASNTGLAFHIGQSGNSADYWKGLIDEAALYGTALSPARVIAHYQAGAGGATVPLSVAGTLTISGAITQARTKALALAGTLAPASTLFRLASTRALAGTLTSTGTIVRTSTRAFAGTLSLAGTVRRMVGKPVAGVLATSGAIRRAVSRQIAGALTPAGALLRSLSRTLTGTLSSAGNLSSTGAGNAIEVAVSGTLSPSGLLRKTSARALLGTLGTVGSLTRAVTRVLASTLTTIGALTKTPGRRTTGTATFSGTVTRQITRPRTYTGTLGLGGSYTDVFIPAPPHAEISGTLYLSGDPPTSGMVITHPPTPLPPEPGAGVETGAPEFIAHTEAGAPESGAHTESGPPEFILRP